MPTSVHTSLVPYVHAVHDAGLDVHVPQHIRRRHRTEHVYITAPDLPGCVILSTADFPSLGQSPQVSVPVKPDREHGSAVHVDFEGGPDDLVVVLRRALAADTVLTRFVPSPRRVRVDLRIPSTALLLDGTLVDTSELVS